MQTLHPGIYRQRVDLPTPIQGKSSIVVGFMGTAPKGDFGGVLVTSWADYVRKFGDYDINSYLAYAVKGFFDNGGQQAVINRVVHYSAGVKTSASATHDFQDSLSAVAITVKAKSDGAWGNDTAVQVIAGADSDHFTLDVFYAGQLVENYDEVTLNNVEDLTKSSDYIVVTVIGTSVPAVVAKTSLTGGDDGLTGLADADYTGDVATKNGVYAFDNQKIGFLVVAGVTTATVIKAMITYCEARNDCSFIMDVPKGSTVAGAKTFITTTIATATENAEAYYPWVVVSDPIGVGKSPVKTIPPSGHVAGAIARMIASYNPWTTPAGTDAQIKGIISLEYEVSDAEQDILNPINLNCLRTFSGLGTLIWGARNLSTGNYMYINVKDLDMYINNTLSSQLMWGVFKDNDTPLWDAIKTEVDKFLTSIWAGKGFKGDKKDDAFFIVCDSTINTPDVVDAGKLYVDIGYAPEKPAEFLTLRVGLKK